MTDEELIRLLADKSPRELTIEDIARLRRRVRQSPEVRMALEAAVQFEGELSAALGTVDLSVDALLERAESRLRAAPRRGISKHWWGLIGLTASLLVAALLWRSRPDPVQVVGPAPQDAQPDASVPETAPEQERPAAPVIASETMVAAAPPADAPSTKTSTRSPPPDVPIIPEGPWAEWMAPDAAPLALDDPQLLSDLASMGLDRLTRSEFEAWWQAVPGQSFGVSQDQIGQRPTVNFDGWAQLRAPWVSDTRLRFVPFDQREFTLYLWRGDEGVALKYHREREPHNWAAYRIKRAAGERNPNWWGLLTTDSGAYYRSNAAIVDVSIAEGRLLLSVADVVLLSVPSPDLPDEILLQAQSRFRGFRWVRAHAPALEIPREQQNVLASGSPADWDWQLATDGAMMLQREPDGSVTLTSTSKTDIVRAYVRLPQTGLFETSIQVAAADPGTGVYLGDADGKPLGHVTFSRDRRTQQLTFASLRPNERRDESDYQLRDFPTPYFVEKQWLRVVTGLGTWHMSCSADDWHYGHVTENPLRDVRGSVRSIGLFCWPGDTPRTIRLQSARVQKLNGLYALTKELPAVETRPTDVDKLRFADSWWSRGWEQRPAEFPAELWWDAWAVATLEEGPPRELAEPLIARLVASAHTRLPPRERWSTLNDLMALSDHWLDERSRLWEHEFATTGFDLNADDRPAGGREAWKHWLTSPCWAYRGHRSEFQRLMAADVLQASARGEWDQARSLAANMQTWLATAHPDQAPRDQAEITDRVARWGKSLSLEALGLAAATVGDVLPIGWRHPLQLPVNKEAYNVHAELQSALESGAYGDACRIVSALQPQVIHGLLPDAGDSDLMVSLNVALQLATEQAPSFYERLQSELTPTGRLLVNQAIADQDAAAIEAATLQYWGTLPGAAALAWLGDRSLSTGDAVGAVLRYRQSGRWADSTLQSQLAPKLELAEGLAGIGQRDATAQSNQPLAGQSIAAVLANSGATVRRWSTAGTSLPPGLPPLQPQKYRWEKLGRFDGQGGQNAGRGEYREGDAFSRQFAVAIDEQRVYISNRFQVNAYDRQSGQGLWAQGLGNEQGEAHAFAFISMTPVVAGESIYARRLAKAGVELVSLKAATGEVRWIARPEDKSEILSDPVILGDAVWVLVSKLTEQEQLDLSWTQYAAATGRLVATTPVVRLRDAWDGQLPVTLSAEGLNVIAAMGGIVVGFDLEGTVHWVRRELWVPPKVDPLEENHFLKPPVILGDRVFLSAINGRLVMCLDVETGRVIWSTPIADLQGLLHVDSELGLAAVPEGLVGLDSTSGRILWRRPLDRSFGVVSVDEDSIWTMRQQVRAADRSWLQMVELDRATGVIIREIPWDLPEAEDWRFGPWWTVGDSVWALAGQTWRDHRRDVVRLTAVPGSRIDDWRIPELGPWTSPLTVERTRMVESIVPGWQLYGVNPDRLRREDNDIRGEKEVLVIRGDSQSSVRFVRMLPAAASSIRVRFGSEPNQTCRWQVLLDGQPLWEHLVTPESPPWQTALVAVPAGSRDHRVVEVVVSSVNDAGFTTCWKEIVVESPGAQALK